MAATLPLCSTLLRRSGLLAAASLSLFCGCATPAVSVVADAEPAGTSYGRSLDRWTRQGRVVTTTEFDTVLLVSATMRSRPFQRAFAEHYISMYRVSTEEQRAKVREGALTEADSGLSFYVQTSSHYPVWNDIAQPPVVSSPPPPPIEAPRPPPAGALPTAVVADAPRTRELPPVPFMPPLGPSAPPGDAPAPQPKTPLSPPPPPVSAAEPAPKVKWRITLVDDKGNESSPVEVVAVGNTAKQTLEGEIIGYQRDPYARAWTVQFPKTRADGQPLYAADTQKLILRFSGPLGQTDLVWTLTSR